MFPVMKTALRLVLGFMIAASLSARAGAEPTGFMLKGDTVTMRPDRSIEVKGSAAVMTQVGMRFTADQLDYNQAEQSLTLSGNIFIYGADGSKVAVKALTLDMTAKRVFTLANGNVGLTSEGETAPAGDTSINFSREYPKTELELRRIEKLESSPARKSRD